MVSTPNTTRFAHWHRTAYPGSERSPLGAGVSTPYTSNVEHHLD